MKKTILTIALSMGVLISTAQLNSDAKYLKEKDSVSLEYYNNIKCLAEADWSGDNSMMIYTINKEATAFFDALEIREQVSKEFFSEAWNKWYNEDCKATQWSMVLYEMKKQIKNSNY